MIRSVRVITMAFAMAMLSVGTTSLAQSRPSVRATSHADRESKAPEYLASLPDDVDAVVALRSLSRLKASEAGEFTVDLLNADAFDRVREGWSDLSDAIGLSPEKAFDAVLGDRVVLAVRRTDETAIPDWTIQTSVSAKVEQLLRKKLKVVPRTIVSGQTLYAVERGALELTVARSAERLGSARVVLAPAGSRLFEDIVRGRAKAERSVLDTPMGRMVFDAPASDVFVLARLREKSDAWAAIVGRMDGNAFIADVRGSISLDAAHGRAVSGWAPESIRPLASEALVAVFDSGASALTEIGDVVGEALPKHLRSVLQDNEALTGREAMLIFASEQGIPTLVSAVELIDLEQGARAGDTAMDGILELAGIAPRRFDGVAPLAVRRVDEGRISLGWLFAPASSHEKGGNAWWIYSTDVSQLDAARGEFVRATPVDDGLRAAAYVRPAALLDALVRIGAPLPPVFSAAARLHSLEWIEFASKAKSLEARLAVRFVQREESATPEPTPNGAP